MEFMCVLSVSGSLASYRVQKESDEEYTAVLQAAAGRRTDIPEEIRLRKNGLEWQGHPPHSQIVQALVQTIETTYRASGDG